MAPSRIDRKRKRPAAKKTKPRRAVARRRSPPTTRKPAKKPRAKTVAARKPPRRAPPRATEPAPLVAAIERDHVATAHAYARAVASGKIVAGRWTIAACNRHLRDLERQGTTAFPYRFDDEAAARICRFAERLRHIKGPLAGKLFVLEPWECFFLCSLFGWLHAETRLRRFRRFYIEVPRGNGKSYLLSIISLYMLSADGEGGAEIYSAATTKDQARIVFRVAQEIVKRAPELCKALDVQRQAHAIVQADTASAFIPLSADENSLEGLNVHFAAVDELHAHKTRAVYDVLETAIGKRSQPMLGTITTAGNDLTGICYEVRDYLLKVLEQTFDDESFFGIVYTIDDDDDWRDESVWLKANPNLGVSVNLETLRDLAKKAERTPAAQSNFKRKHLDVWVGANAALFNLEDWKACADPTLTEEQFAGEEAIAAVDLATRDDLAPRVTAFRRLVDGVAHYYLFARGYISQEAVDDARNASYPGWATTGWLRVNEGNAVDMARIEDEIIEDASRFQLREVVVDPWQAMQLGQQLMARGATVVELPMNTKNLSEATKELGALMKQRRVHHCGDPVFAWCIGNVVGHYDAKENVYPRKERAENKIDEAVAAIMALSRWLTAEPAEPSVLETEGIRFA